MNRNWIPLTPRQPEISSAAARVRHSAVLGEVSFDIFCSHRCWYTFFPVFFKMSTISGSHLGSMLVHCCFVFSNLFRTWFSVAFVNGSLRFLETRILTNHCYEKLSIEDILSTSLISWQMLASFWDPLGLQTSTLFYIDLLIPFRMLFSLFF